jgi:hypothetical protein
MSVFTNPASAAGEHASQYVAAVLDLLGTRDPIEVMRGMPAFLERLLGGTPLPQLTEPEAPGKWSIRDVLRHLADSEIVWACRLRLVVAQNRPPLVGYDQDLWAERLEYGRSDARDAFDDFRILRRSNLRIIEQLSAEDLKRVGVHAERGEQRLEEMIRLQAGHDLLHILQLERIREMTRGSV